MIYVALFRGINVGGKHIVKMDALRQLFAELGAGNVTTYIQSGNVVFETDDSPEAFGEKLTKAFSARFGFSSMIQLVDRPTLEKLISGLPFSDEERAQAQAAKPDVEHLYVYFTQDPASDEKLTGILEAYDGPDRAVGGRGGVYVLTWGSVRKSALASRIDKVLDQPTARNWKTVTQIAGLMKGRP